MDPRCPELVLPRWFGSRNVTLVDPGGTWTFFPRALGQKSHRPEKVPPSSQRRNVAMLPFALFESPLILGSVHVGVHPAQVLQSDMRPLRCGSREIRAWPRRSSQSPGLGDCLLIFLRGGEHFWSLWFSLLRGLLEDFKSACGLAKELGVFVCEQRYAAGRRPLP